MSSNWPPYTFFFVKMANQLLVIDVLPTILSLDEYNKKIPISLYYNQEKGDRKERKYMIKIYI